MPAVLHYEKIIPPEALDDYESLYQYFIDCINPIWLDLYEMDIEIAGDYCNIDYYGYNFLFDDTGQYIKDDILHDSEIQVPRVVGAYGYSRIDNLQNEGNRSRLRGLFKIRKTINGIEYDKGHFMAHAVGGPMDVNMFWQRSDINRPLSAEGKLYAKMEKYTLQNPGTFLFSRPIYKDYSLVPAFLEFGYITKQKQICYHLFPN